MTDDERFELTNRVLAIEDPRARSLELIEWQRLIDELYVDSLIEAWSGEGCALS